MVRFGSDDLPLQMGDFEAPAVNFQGCIRISTKQPVFFNAKFLRFFGNVAQLLPWNTCKWVSWSLDLFFWCLETVPKILPNSNGDFSHYSHTMGSQSVKNRQLSKSKLPMFSATTTVRSGQSVDPGYLMYIGDDIQPGYIPGLCHEPLEWSISIACNVMLRFWPLSTGIIKCHPFWRDLTWWKWIGKFRGISIPFP